MTMHHHYTISQLASQFALRTDTLRYYERQGILTPSARSDAGYRLYSERDRLQLQFVLRAKAVGFSLAEIKHLLALKVYKTAHSCQEVKDYTSLKISEIAAKIAELQEIKALLQQMHDACCGGPESAEHCSILRMLESGTQPKNG